MGLLDYLTKKVGPAHPNDPLWMDLAKTYGLMDESTKGPDTSKYPEIGKPRVNQEQSGTGMRASTMGERIKGLFQTGAEEVAKQPAAQIADLTGMSPVNFQQTANSFTTPRPEVMGAALPFGPGKNLGSLKPTGPDAESLAEIAETEAMMKRILGESAPVAPIVKPASFNQSDEVNRLIAQATGKPASAVPKVTNVDLEKELFKNNASGDKLGMAGSIEESSALGGAERVIDRGAGPVPLLYGRETVARPGEKVGIRYPDGTIKWDQQERKRVYR